MQLPTLELSALPELDSLTGAFGSLISPVQMQAGDDSMVVVMVFVYDLMQSF